MNCWQRNQPPIAPIYPSSQQRDTIIRGQGRSRPILTSNFTSADSPEKIISFYGHHGECGIGEKVRGRELCKGNSTPFGEYFAYIETDLYQSTKTTKFTLEIRWHGCSDRVE